jgi:hypothetical protein
VFGPKIKIPPDLMKRLEECADIAGYSSAREFALHVLESAVAEIKRADNGDEKAVEERLRGLGYIE